MTNPTGVIRLDNKEAFIEYSVELMKPAIRQIYILTPDFDREWLGAPEFVEQLKLCLVKNRRMNVKMLIADPTTGIRSQHPLISLIKRLSRFKARVITEEFLDKQPLKNTQLLIDLNGIVMRQSFNDFIGFAHFQDKQTVKNLLEDFEQYWRFSTTHADLRHVYL
jgi:hypothetical protein